MGHDAVFYLACFWAAFLLCFPFGAASLEMARLSLAGKPRSAFSVAAGAVLTSAGWALLSYLGAGTLAHRLQVSGIDVLLFGAAALLVGWLSWQAFRDSRSAAADDPRPMKPGDSSGMIAQAVKGALLGLLNLQAVASWVLILALLRKAGLQIPAGGFSWLPFFLDVASGYGFFFLMVIRFSQRFGRVQTAAWRSKLLRVVAALLFCLALLFAAAALRFSLR